MDTSEVKAIVDEAAPAMREALWLGHWHLDFAFCPCDNDGWTAQCYRKPPYRRATITIDPARAEDRADVLDSLRHELLHCVLGEFDVYANMVQTNIDKDDGPAVAVEERAFTLAVERTVNHLECVLDGLGFTPERLAGGETLRLSEGPADDAPGPRLVQLRNPIDRRYRLIDRSTGSIIARHDEPFEDVPFAEAVGDG